MSGLEFIAQNAVRAGRKFQMWKNRRLVPRRRNKMVAKKKRSRSTPSTLQIPRISKGNQYYPRFNYAPMPIQHRSILTYTSEQKTVGGAIGGVVGIVHEYALNGLYDPDLSGVGHQPMGFDQLSAMWKRYRVWKVDFKIRCFAPTTAAFLVAQVNNSQVPSGTVAGQTYSTLNERTNCATKIFYFDDDRTVYGSFTMNEIEGHSIQDENYTGGDTGNPGNLAKLVIGCGDTDGLNSAGFKYFVELVYHVQWHNRQTLTQS